MIATLHGKFISRTFVVYLISASISLGSQIWDISFTYSLRFKVYWNVSCSCRICAYDWYVHHFKREIVMVKNSYAFIEMQTRVTKLFRRVNYDTLCSIRRVCFAQTNAPMKWYASRNYNSYVKSCKNNWWLWLMCLLAPSLSSLKNLVLL